MCVLFAPNVLNVIYVNNVHNMFNALNLYKARSARLRLPLDADTLRREGADRNVSVAALIDARRPGALSKGEEGGPRQ